MSEAQHHIDDDEHNEVYRPPKEVPLHEILNKDTDDQALNKYKQQVNACVCAINFLFIIIF